MEITLPDGRKTIIDDADWELISAHRWRRLPSGNTSYAISNIDGRTVSLHKFLTGYDRTDHKDGDGLNNRRSNLRESNRSQNAMNRVKIAGTSSKYKGVYWKKQRKQWCAQIELNGKKKHIGYFRSEERAAIAYNDMASEMFGEFALLNDVEV